MAAKNSIKIYLPNSYYHIYNRGVEKRNIFLDQQDYSVFLSYLKEYLTPKSTEELRRKLTNENLRFKEKSEILKALRLNNFYNKIQLLCYCLMPNHFHFIVKQSSDNSIDQFMNSFCLRYSMYFNKKYHRVGKLFQGVYKAVLVKSEEQLLHLSKYIHLNPLGFKFNKLSIKIDLKHILFSQPSSYPHFIGKVNQNWVIPSKILSYYQKGDPSKLYKHFVESSFEKKSILTPKLLIDEQEE